MTWYAVRSKPNREEALWREIGAHGHEAFYPRLRVWPVNPRAHKVRPYFPGYVFVQANLHLVGAAAFSRLPYAQGLVSFGGEPAVVADEMLAAIRVRVDDINASGGDAIEARGGRTPSLKTGDEVIVSDGPFVGCKAIFDARLAGCDRVRVLMHFLEPRPLRLELPAAQIQSTNRR